MVVPSRTQIILIFDLGDEWVGLWFLKGVGNRRVMKKHFVFIKLGVVISIA